MTLMVQISLARLVEAHAMGHAYQYGAFLETISNTQISADLMEWFLSLPPFCLRLRLHSLRPLLALKRSPRRSLERSRTRSSAAATQHSLFPPMMCLIRLSSLTTTLMRGQRRRMI
ncbi:hypothetical protein K435DRAFT_492456 [Dendrothele bispora CBS 962.96]|uniref:Uncharacterized protein n=1 Tax=Dendrothele bispora (strain CBS 962.96) TaxID=1314807 RepID=A0A4V4HBU7_DENBC|nr:hypothetical protein K435DRAFT_492456 [Dendrothele bispora CBS 962.96]